MQHATCRPLKPLKHITYWHPHECEVCYWPLIVSQQTLSSLISLVEALIRSVSGIDNCHWPLFMSQQTISSLSSPIKALIRPASGIYTFHRLRKGSFLSSTLHICDWLNCIKNFHDINGTSSTSSCWNLPKPVRSPWRWWLCVSLKHCHIQSVYSAKSQEITIIWS